MDTRQSANGAVDGAAPLAPEWGADLTKMEGDARLPLTLILPAGGWQLLNFHELWQFRELLYLLAWRDVRVRYKQTALGAAWAILQPVLMMAVFTIFFGKMAKVRSADLPYPIFAFLGLLPWTFFSTAIANAGNSVIGSERLITKIYFPRLVIPLASVGAAVGDFLVACVVLIPLILFYYLQGAHLRIGPQVLLLPAIFGLILITAIGIGTLLAALNVAYRDFRYVIPFLVQLWLFATPTVYMQAFTGPGIKMQIALYANPMAGLIGSSRSAATGLPIPWGHLAVSAISGCVLFLTGCLYFRKVEDRFADLI